MARAGRQRPPAIDLDQWRFRVAGLVGQEVQWDWREFTALPRVDVFGDFHCVTRWSRLGNLWQGVPTRELIRRAGGARPKRITRCFTGTTRVWTTNLPLEHFLAEDALVAIFHDGESISTEHGGPARLIVPRLYAWKSAKWVAGVELDRGRPARFLGGQRLPYARRPLDRGEVRIATVGAANVGSRERIARKRARQAEPPNATYFSQYRELLRNLWADPLVRASATDALPPTKSTSSMLSKPTGRRLRTGGSAPQSMQTVRLHASSKSGPY